MKKYTPPPSTKITAVSCDGDKKETTVSPRISARAYSIKNRHTPYTTI